ncbi:MAG: hypothetical protein HY908_12860, partial [Myxococcales bacterium]|nr:hypothetical protein [Myxococcales bacterium]
MLASAVAAIERHALPARLAAERQHREACRALERRLAEVEQRIPWWERVAFFHDAPDELTARTLGTELAAARAGLERASAELATAGAAAGAESPPVELGYRIDRVIRETLADGRVGRLAAAGKPIALELEALAERTLELFTAGFDASATVAALVDPAARGALANRAGRPPARDARLGWAPATGEQIGAWAARALDGPALATALAILARERSECDAATRALAAARSRVTAWEALAPGKSPSELAVDEVAGHLAREQAEAVSAAASVAIQIEGSLAAYPPVGVAEQALAAAAILRCLRPKQEDALSPEGERLVTAAADVRAIFLAALVELERAFGVAFPGLMARLSPRAAPGRAA